MLTCTSIQYMYMYVYAHMHVYGLLICPYSTGTHDLYVGMNVYMYVHPSEKTDSHNLLSYCTFKTCTHTHTHTHHTQYTDTYILYIPSDLGINFIVNTIFPLGSRGYCGSKQKTESYQIYICLYAH